MGEVLEVEIQARMSDLNFSGHVDNVEVVRVLDEARMRFYGWGRHADRVGIRADPGVLDGVPDGVRPPVVAQRVDYLAELRLAPIEPYRVRVWVGHVGGSSFTVQSEIRTSAPGHPEVTAVVAETSVVLWDGSAGRPWRIDATVRAALLRYEGDPVPLRPRPGA